MIFSGPVMVAMILECTGKMLKIKEFVEVDGKEEALIDHVYVNRYDGWCADCGYTTVCPD